MEEKENKASFRASWRAPKNGRILSGLVLIGVGLVLMANQLGIFQPEWLFTWPVFLIVLGLYVGAKHLFSNPGWIILVGIGVIFLSERVFPEIEISRYWPVVFILAGLVMVFKPYRRRGYYNWHKQGSEGHCDSSNWCNVESETSEDFLNSTNIMGGVKKNVISKQFKGGNIVCIMGGAEINLSQADIQETATLEMTQIMGGTKLIVPANWEIRSEAVVILGGIEDKRAIVIDRNATSSKVLIIKGTCIFGGIAIKSY